jgi:hypothetical protein
MLNSDSHLPENTASPIIVLMFKFDVWCVNTFSYRESNLKGDFFFAEYVQESTRHLHLLHSNTLLRNIISQQWNYGFTILQQWPCRGPMTGVFEHSNL